MPVFDAPPTVDPVTGRIPPYKQVLRQDQTTGVWSTKYEYSDTPAPRVNTIVGGSTYTSGMRSGPTTPAIPGEEKVENTPFEASPLETAFQAGGERRQNEADRQQREEAAKQVDFKGMSISQLQNYLNPTFGQKAFATVVGGVNPLIGTAMSVNKFLAQKELDKRMEEVQETYRSPEYRAQSLAQERGGFIQSPQQKAIADKITQDPMTGDASIAEEIAAQDRYQAALERRRQNVEQERGGAIQPARSVQQQMQDAMRDAAMRGGSRDVGERAATNAFNQATSGFKYDGSVNTSFKGTAMESTQIGTFSERREKEREGLNEDGSTQPGSIAEQRAIAGELTQPERRQVDRDNPVSNKAGKNEVSDKHGNAVTNQGKAINTGAKYNPRMREKEGNQGGKSTRIICSELYRQGLISKEDYVLDLYYTSKHLTEQHTAGYWHFAVPAVKAMRRSKFWTAFWKEIAYNRLQDIKWRLGEGKFNLRGRIYSSVFEPFCYISGYFTPNSDYNELYEGEN
jgi:hypothetical protein